jgi:hypothetical protein
MAQIGENGLFGQVLPGCNAGSISIPAMEGPEKPCKMRRSLSSN